MDERLIEWSRELVRLGLPLRTGMMVHREDGHLDLTHVGTVAMIEEWACEELGWHGIDTFVDDDGLWAAATETEHTGHIFPSRWLAVLHVIMTGFREKAEQEERKRKAERFHELLAERAETDLTSLRVTFRIGRTIGGRENVNTMIPISYSSEARTVSGCPGIEGKVYTVGVAAIEKIESRVLRPEWVELA